jgi:phosphatidylserine decarboxylase
MAEIKIWDRSNKTYFTEKVLGDKWIRLGYENQLGRWITGLRLFQSLTSKIVAAYQNSPFSKQSISQFVKDYGIKSELFEQPDSGYDNFNDFFIRKVKNLDHFFPENDNEFVMRSPAEARLSVFEFDTQKLETQLVIKGVTVSLKEFVPPEMLIKLGLSDLKGLGHAWVFRLCPVDYHRFHFFDSGTAFQPFHLGHKLNSVNPSSLNALPRVFLENERQICIQKTDHFGDILYIEVGALCVGKIVQTFDPNEKVHRGQEKGYFEFGGSTVVLISLADNLKPHADILNKTREGFETKVFLGDAIGEATNL